MGSIQIESGGYQLLPQYHSQPDPLRVIHVGAGAAGLLMAYKMQKNIKGYELVCYEKNSNVGGTWFENRYPGCACDIPAHIYTYPFEPNPNWSSFYAYGPEIRQYFEDFAAKYDLGRYIKFECRVLSAVWDEEKGIYLVEVDHHGTIIKDWCHVFVNGGGFLNSWKWPTVPGLHEFKGTLVHSANWDPDVDYTDKRVGVIGTGSSAIQIVPQVQKKAKHLTTFMRSVTWISPPVGSDLLQKSKKESDLTKDAIPQGAQYLFSEEDKKRFREDPDHLLAFRKQLETEVNVGFNVFMKDSEASKEAEKFMRAEMNRRIGPGHEELKEKLIPSWPPGCRRLTPGDGYLEALVKSNVLTVHKEIAKVVPEGVIDETGQLYELDILVCATGFNIAFNPSFQVQGRDGRLMKDVFTPEPQVYLGLTVPHFPNYFIVNGPRGNWAQGSALASHEVQVDYIVKCIKKMQEEKVKSIEIKGEAVRDLNEHLEAWHHLSVWDAPCKSWYKNNIVGGKLWIWGGSGLHYIKTIKEVKFEHYDFVYQTSNMFAFLGNGFTEPEVLKQKDRLAPYIRKSDTPWEM